MTTVPLYMSFCDLPYIHISLKDTFWPMWIMAGANAFNIILVKNFFDNIPSSYVEAAKMDGASDMKILIKIMLPLSMPVLVTISIFTFNGTWGQFFWPYLLISKDEIMPLGEKIYILQKELSIDEHMMALCLMMVPVMVLFAIFQKYIMQGMSIGGIKG